MNNTCIKLYLLLFCSLPLALRSNDRVRVATREECKIFVKKFIRELKKESEAKRPDGKPSIPARHCLGLYNELCSKPEYWIEYLTDEWVKANWTNKQLEDDNFLKVCFLLFIKGSLDSN